MITSTNLTLFIEVWPPPTGRHGFLLYIGQYRTLLGGVVDRLFISSTQWGPMTLPLNLQEDRIGMFNIPAF